MNQTLGTSRIKTIIFVDNIIVSKWVNEIIKFVEQHQSFEVQALIVNGSSRPSKNSFSYKLLRKLDRRLFKFNPDPFSKEEVSYSLKEKVYTVNPIQKKYSDFFNEDDINLVKEANPDLVLRFGFRILRGEILNIPKYGIWSLHHADNDVNRGGPPGFWEVVKKEPVTGITLQRLTENLDGGGFIGKAFVKTDYTSFNRNQSAVFWSGVELFKTKLDELARGKLQVPNEVDAINPFTTFYTYPLYKDPGNFDSILFGLRLGWEASLRKVLDSLYCQQWTIGYSVKDHLENALFRYKFLKPPKNCIWADPFLIKHENETFLFAEQKKGTKPGEIICFKFDGISKTFKYLDVVLKEPFHLSYPCVFEYQGSYYMIPESGDYKQVVLYKSSNFPFEWEKVKTLLADTEAFDATPYFHNGIWYLFATIKSNHGVSANELLYIYYTNDILNGEWKSHAMNPVKHDVRGARPAGKLFVENGKLYRPGQIGSHKYGYGIQFFEVLKLSPNEFEEIPISDIKPVWDTILLATHTFNYIAGLSVIDVQQLVRKF